MSMGQKHYIPVTAETAVPNQKEKAALLRRVITAALEAEGLTCPCEIDVLLTDDEGIRQINREMRQLDAATDVLSFPAFSLQPGVLPEPEEDADPGTGRIPLGDMVISVPPRHSRYIPATQPVTAQKIVRRKCLFRSMEKTATMTT